MSCRKKSIYKVEGGREGKKRHQSGAKSECSTKFCNIWSRSKAVWKSSSAVPGRCIYFHYAKGNSLYLVAGILDYFCLCLCTQKSVQARKWTKYRKVRQYCHHRINDAAAAIIYFYQRKDVYEKCHWLFQERKVRLQEDCVNFPALSYTFTHL